jgi:hypothetical protein
MVEDRHNLDMAAPARRLAALAQVHVAVALRVAPSDRDTGTALERDTVWLPAGQADIPDHTLGVADTAHRAGKVVDKAPTVSRHPAQPR